MFSKPEQFTAATRALFESQIATFHALGSKTIEGVEKALALNIGAAKASVEKSIAITKQLSCAKDPQEFLSLSAAQAKPTAEIIASYSRDLAAVAASLRDEFTKTAEVQFTATKNKLTTLVDDVTNSAPAASEQAVAMLKLVVNTAGAGYEQLASATKQADKTVEAQLVDATERISSTTEKAAPKGSKK